MRSGNDRSEVRSPFTTRFAPSPTGLLHLGHVANAAYVWGLAQAHGGDVVLRIEDHDRGRYRPEYETEILGELEWLGLQPSTGATDAMGNIAPYRQRDCLDEYHRVANRLHALGLLYACDCTRSDILAVGDAPPGKEVPYPGRCRDRGLSHGPNRGLRVMLPNTAVAFEDVNLGPQVQTPAQQCGDMLIRDRAGNWTYQYCVTIDDLAQDVTSVIRGEDLLTSTGRQLLLRSLLGTSGELSFFHHPLVRDHDGRKLSKRDGDLGIKAMRRSGMTPEEVLGRACCAVGLRGFDAPVAPTELGQLVRKAVLR